MKKLLFLILLMPVFCSGQTKLDQAQLPLIPESAQAQLNNNLIIYVGDSQTANGESVSGITQAYRTNGYTTWANALSGSKLFSPVNGNQGVPANYTTDVIARLGAILALRPKVVLLLIGTNDCSGNISAAAIEANYATIYAALRSINCIIIQSTILPRFGTSALTGPQETVRQAVNAWILTQAAPDLITINAESSMNSSGDFQSDGLHPNTTGAYILGLLFATQISTIQSTIGNISDVLQADNAFTGNPTLSGTGGSTSSASGAVATGWTLNGASAGGTTVVGSKDANDRQIVTLSGTYTGSTPNVLLTNGNTAISTLKQGDVVEGFIDFEVTGTIANANAVSFFLDIYKTGGIEINQGYSLLSNDNIALPLTTGRYTFRTPPLTISDVPTAFTNAIYIFLNTGSSTAISGSIKIYKAGVRKVPTASNLSAYQALLSGLGYVKQSGNTTSYSPTVPTTDLSGTLQPAQEPAHTGDVTNSAGSTALAIGSGKVTNAMLGGSITNDNLVSSSNTDLRFLQLMGSAIKGYNPANVLGVNLTTFSMISGDTFWQAVYVPKATTLTGIKIWLPTSGVYTSTGYNGVGLYTINTGTGLLTQVAASTTSATVWASAAAPATLSIPFSSTYAATEGVYYVAMLYQSSGQTTAPALYRLSSTTSLNAYDFANSMKVVGLQTGQTTLPSTQASSGLAAQNISFYFFLY